MFPWQTKSYGPRSRLVVCCDSFVRYREILQYSHPGYTQRTPLTEQYTQTIRDTVKREYPDANPETASRQFVHNRRGQLIWMHTMTEEVCCTYAKHNKRTHTQDGYVDPDEIEKHITTSEGSVNHTC